jgi:hypothetical protein
MLVNFSILHFGKYFFPQCSTPLVGMRLCRHVPNSPRDKNKMMHHLCLLEKVFFWPPKLYCLSSEKGKKTFSSTLNFMILQMVSNECVKFSRHVNRRVNYKILQLKVPIMLQLCTIHLAFDRGCIEAVLIENTFRTLGVKQASKANFLQM